MEESPRLFSDRCRLQQIAGLGCCDHATLAGALHRFHDNRAAFTDRSGRGCTLPDGGRCRLNHRGHEHRSWCHKRLYRRGLKARRFKEIGFTTFRQDTRQFAGLFIGSRLPLMTVARALRTATAAGAFAETIGVCGICSLDTLGFDSDGNGQIVRRLTFGHGGIKFRSHGGDNGVTLGHARFRTNAIGLLTAIIAPVKVTILRVAIALVARLITVAVVLLTLVGVAGLLITLLIVVTVLIAIVTVAPEALFALALIPLPLIPLALIPLALFPLALLGILKLLVGLTGLINLGLASELAIGRLVIVLVDVVVIVAVAESVILIQTR